MSQYFERLDEYARAMMLANHQRREQDFRRASESFAGLWNSRECKAYIKGLGVFAIRLNKSKREEERTAFLSDYSSYGLAGNRIAFSSGPIAYHLREELFESLAGII